MLGIHGKKNTSGTEEEREGGAMEERKSNPCYWLLSEIYM